MSSAGAGAGASAQAALVARIEAAAVAKAMGGAAAEVRAAVQDMLDQGYLKQIDEDLAYCPRRHAFEASRGKCPRCDLDPGDPPSTTVLVSLDDEITRAEDSTPTDEEGDGTPADPPGTLEKLESALNDSACPNAQDVAMKLAPLWSKGLPPDSAAVRQLAADHGWPPDTVECIERSFAQIARTEGNGPPGPVDSQSSADIRFWRDGEEIRWQIRNHLAGLTATGRSGAVTLNGIRFNRHARAEKLLRERIEHLENLARELAERRKAFFDESDPAKAMRILTKQALTQKEICGSTGISATMMHYWCEYRGRKIKKSKGVTVAQAPMLSMRVGVEVETSHGTFPLATFFTKPTRMKGGAGRTQEAVQEDVEDLIAEAKKQGLNSDEILNTIRQEHGIDLAPRTARKYKERVAKANR